MILLPPRWTLDELAAGADRGVEIFRDQRLSEAREDYSSHFDEARAAVEDLLELTADLTELEHVDSRAVIEGGYLEALRYLAAPPVSEDDLETLSGVPERQFGDADKWSAVVETVVNYIDAQRFPWIIEHGEPTDEERFAAVISTAAQMAAQKVLTARRNEAKAEQEALVKDALRAAAFEEVRPREIASVRAFPRPGEFCGESKVGKNKADVVVGLRDNRVLVVECKVSNSKVNSTKRIGEASAKAREWTDSFGVLSIVPSAVIAGVYNIRNLAVAQERGLTIWWSHDIASMNIGAMIRWINSTG